MNRRSQLACNLTIFFRFPFSFSSDREDISNTRECSTAFPNTSIKGRQKYFATRHILDSLQSSRNLVPRAHVSFGADQKTRGLWERDWWQEPITGKMQLPHIPVTVLSQTDLLLVWIYREFRTPREPMWPITSTDLFFSGHWHFHRKI